MAEHSSTVSSDACAPQAEAPATGVRGSGR